MQQQRSQKSDENPVLTVCQDSSHGAGKASRIYRWILSYVQIIIRASDVRVPYRRILLLFLAEALVLGLARLPISLDFKLFAFYDPGSALKADGLLASGLKPTVDFAYSYGLLPLGVGQVWFGILGRTPAAYQALASVAALLVAWGMARFVAALDAKWWAVALCMFAMPYALVADYLNQTHAMEAAILAHALAEHARGRRGRALLLATLGAFVKPSMAYVYGLVLVICIVVSAVRARNWSKLVRELLPATVAGGLTAAVLGAVYGTLPLVHTLLPLNASKSYKAANFGFFFGVGREFWWPPADKRTLGYYVFSEVGFWLAATLVVTGLGVWLLTRYLRQDRTRTPAVEALLGVITLHLAFVCLLYAWAGSWVYYPYLLVLALVGVVGQLTLRWHRPLIAAMVVLAVLGQVGNYFLWMYAWQGKVRTADTAGLWAYTDIDQEWRDVRAKIAGRKEFLLTNGYLDHLATPPLKGVQSWFMSPALQTPAELAWLKQAIGQADVVVRLNELEQQKLDPWMEPELRDATADFEPEWRGNYVTLMKRRTKP